jgi:hypothetical protein
MAGNANSGRKDKFTRDALVLEMKSREADGDKRGMRKVAVAVWDLAESGERWAAEFIRDTIDGKPAQQVVHTGDDEGGPVKMIITGVPRDGD